MSRVLSNSLRELIFVPLLAIVVAIVLHVTIVLLLPSLCIRFLVSKLAQRKGKGNSLGNMVSLPSTHHAIMGDKDSMLLCTVLEGEPDLDHIRTEFSKHVLHAADSSGMLLYPELRQSIVSWWGFYFWKDCQTFNLNRQIFEDKADIHRNQGVLDLNGLSGQDYIAQLQRKNWEFGKEPLWRFIIVPNVLLDGVVSEGNKHFALFIHFHHALCDANSLLRMMDKVSTPRTSGSSSPRTTASSLFGFKLWAFMSSPYHLAEIIWDMLSASYDGIPIFRNSIPIQTFAFSTRRGPALLVTKGNARLRDTTVSSLLISGITSSIRRESLQLGCQLKSKVHIAIILPHPNERDCLTNSAKLGIIRLPIDEENVLKRLRFIEEELNKIKKSFLPDLFHLLISLSSAQLPSILSMFFQATYARGSFLGLSNVPGVPFPIEAFGYKLKDAFPVTFGVTGNNAMMFFFLTTSGNTRISVMTDKGVFRDQTHLDQMVQTIVSTLKNLH